MSAKKTFFLHIGTGKTGTTAIQSFCVENRKELERSGVYYPSLGIRGVGHHYFGHLWGTGWFDDEGLKEFKREHSWKELRAMFDSRSDNMLISTESLTAAFAQKEESLEEVHAAFDGVDIKVIVYLRRQDSHLESWFNTRIKSGVADLPFEKVTSTPAFYHFGEFLDKIADVFGFENMIVRPYERSQFLEGNIIDDFLSCINITRTDAMVLPPKGVNEKINLQLLEFLRLSNLVDRPWELKFQYNQQAQRIDKAYGLTTDTGGLFDGKYRKAFMQEFEETNAYVARKYLGRESGQLFTESMDDKPANTTPLTLEQVIEFSVRMWESNHFDKENYVKLPSRLVALIRYLKKLFSGNES